MRQPLARRLGRTCTQICFFLYKNTGETACIHAHALGQTLEKQLAYTTLGYSEWDLCRFSPPRGRGGKRGPCPAAASIPQRGSPLWGTPPSLVGGCDAPRGAAPPSSYHFAPLHATALPPPHPRGFRPGRPAVHDARREERGSRGGVGGDRRRAEEKRGRDWRESTPADEN